MGFQTADIFPHPLQRSGVGKHLADLLQTFPLIAVQYPADLIAVQQAAVVDLLLEKGREGQQRQFGTDGFKEGDPAGLGENQIRLGHILMDLVGVAYNINIFISAVKAVIGLLVGAGNDCGVYPGQGIQLPVEAFGAGQQSQPAAHDQQFLPILSGLFPVDAAKFRPYRNTADQCLFPVALLVPPTPPVPAPDPPDSSRFPD